MPAPPEKKATSRTPQIVTLIVDDSMSMRDSEVRTRSKAQIATESMQDLVMTIQSLSMGSHGFRYLLNIAKAGDHVTTIAEASVPNEVDLERLAIHGDSNSTNMEPAFDWAFTTVQKSLSICRALPTYDEPRSPPPLVVMLSDAENIGPEIEQSVSKLRSISFQGGVVNVVACGLGVTPENSAKLELILSEAELATNVDPTDLAAYIASVAATMRGSDVYQESITPEVSRSTIKSHEPTPQPTEHAPTMPPAHTGADAAMQQAAAGDDSEATTLAPAQASSAPAEAVPSWDAEEEQLRKMEEQLRQMSIEIERSRESSLMQLQKEKTGQAEQVEVDVCRPAQYVNFKILDATISDERLIDAQEGLYAGLKYRFVVCIAMEADVRFAMGVQGKVERPPIETVILDVMLALEENLEIVGERWSTLEWPECGPSVNNAEFIMSPEREGPSNLKVLIYYQHDLLFCGAIKFTVRSEGDDWPPGERPITWMELGETSRRQLSLFRNFQDLDREVRRGINISVHRRAPDLFDMVFFLRSSGPVPRAYPLSVQISEREISGYLARSRLALRLLTNGIDHPESDGYSTEKFLDDMSLMGHELWNRLFGSGNGQRLAAMLFQELAGSGDIIQIWIHAKALDFIFPWPWLYWPPVVAGKHRETDVRQFWGYRYVIEQLRQLKQEKRHESTITGEPLRIAGALHNFPAAATERRFFMECSAKYAERLTWAEVQPVDWRQFLAKSDAHLLYFYCHGHTEQPLDAVGAEMFRILERFAKTSPAEAAAWIDSLSAETRRKVRGESVIAIEREILSMADLRQFKSEDPSLKPVVFLNMCESSEFYPGATNNLVDVFLRGGARGVIGTEVPVLAAFGDAFARGFFEAFFAGGKTGEGNEIGAVLWQLRRKFLDEGNPLGFIYTYFGDATTRLKPAIID